MILFSRNALNTKNAQDSVWKDWKKSPLCFILYWIITFLVFGRKNSNVWKMRLFENIFVHCAIIHTQSAKMCKSSPKISLKIIIIWWPFSAYLKWSHKNRTERWNGIVWIQCQWRTNWVGYSCHYCNTMSNRFFAITGWTNDMWTKFRWTLWVDLFHFLNSVKKLQSWIFDPKFLVYIDYSSNECVFVPVFIGRTESSLERHWEIKLSQFPCTFPNIPPAGNWPNNFGNNTQDFVFRMYSVVFRGIFRTCPVV